MPRFAAKMLGLVALMITRHKVDWAPTADLTAAVIGGLLHGLVSD